MQPSGSRTVSGEGVALHLAPGGVGSRTLAAALDAMVQLIALSVLVLLGVAVGGRSDPAALRAVLVTEVVLALAGYPILCEWLTRGRTLGKAVFGLRVVRDDGGPIGFRQALVRGLSGLVLDKPGLLAPLSTVAGLVVISSSAREKRIGDMLAGTVVLNERSAPQPLATPPAWVPVALQPWVLCLDLSRLDDRLALHVRQFVSRASQLSDAGRAALGEDLRRRVLAVTTPPPPPFASTPDVLMGVLAERRRRAAAGTPGPWRGAGPAHQPPVPVARRDGPFVVPG